MTYGEALILGIVQGLTEFLPISSSGHLVIFQNLFHIRPENVTFEVAVHLGTLVSVAAVYYRDIGKILRSITRALYRGKPLSAFQADADFRLAIYIIIGTIPAVLAGFFLKDFFVSIFHDSKLIGITLLCTGVVILLTRRVSPGKSPLTTGRSILIGMAQSVAILPGISRSGLTISSGLFLGLSRNEAARFSFLLSIPAILGAALLEVIEIDSAGLARWPTLLVGFITAAIVGYLAIRWLLSLIQSGKFSRFAPYCFIAGIIVLLLVK